ncbi:MAG: hypothetical protein GXO49_05195 [Chlorobi bacterium]|nr:hypothetical protein [Chlorobiota bacterium]
MVSKKICFDNNFLISSSILGKKKIDLINLYEASVINLKGRIICVLSDKENFVFISSTIENFMEIIHKIIDIAPDDITNKLKEIDEKEINRKNTSFTLFLIIANIFLIGVAIYNII